MRNIFEFLIYTYRMSTQHYLIPILYGYIVLSSYYSAGFLFFSLFLVIVCLSRLVFTKRVWVDNTVKIALAFPFVIALAIGASMVLIETYSPGSNVKPPVSAADTSLSDFIEAFLTTFTILVFSLWSSFTNGEPKPELYVNAILRSMIEKRESLMPFFCVFAIMLTSKIVNVELGSIFAICWIAKYVLNVEEPKSKEKLVHAHAM